MVYRIVTKEIKEVMKELKIKGLSYKAIGIILGLSQSTVQYHLDESQKKKTIERAVKNQKTRDRKEYIRKYQSERYKNDPEFREKVQRYNRENQRRKNGN